MESVLLSYFLLKEGCFIGYIYKIENKINSKKYIGKTNHLNPLYRFREHINDSKKERYKNRPLYRAFKKYGIENFTFDVIEQTDNTEEREKYYIEKFSSYGNNGYNATKGGDGNQYLNLDEKEVCEYHTTISNYILGNTSNHFNVDSGTIRKILVKNNIKWITKKEFSSMNSYIKTGGIYQIDPTTLEIINIFYTPADANRFLNKNPKNTNIRSVLFYERKYNKAFGYYWCIGKEYEDYISHLSI